MRMAKASSVKGEDTRSSRAVSLDCRNERCRQPYRRADLAHRRQYRRGFVAARRSRRIAVRPPDQLGKIVRNSGYIAMKRINEDVAFHPGGDRRNGQQRAAPLAMPNRPENFCVLSRSARPTPDAG
jgi:hypothetical protein